MSYYKLLYRSPWPTYPDVQMNCVIVWHRAAYDTETRHETPTQLILNSFVHCVSCLGKWSHFPYFFTKLACSCHFGHVSYVSDAHAIISLPSRRKRWRNDTKTEALSSSSNTSQFAPEYFIREARQQENSSLLNCHCSQYVGFIMIKEGDKWNFTLILKANDIKKVSK